MAEGSGPTGLLFRVKLEASLVRGETWNKDLPLNGLPASQPGFPDWSVPFHSSAQSPGKHAKEL